MVQQVLHTGLLVPWRSDSFTVLLCLEVVIIRPLVKHAPFLRGGRFEYANKAMKIDIPVVLDDAFEHNIIDNRVAKRHSKIFQTTMKYLGRDLEIGLFYILHQELGQGFVPFSML